MLKLFLSTMKSQQTFRSQTKGGCLTQILVALGIFVLICMLIVGGGLFFGYRKAVSFTTAEPPSPVPTYSQEKLEEHYTNALKPRLSQFYKELEASPETKQAASEVGRSEVAKSSAKNQTQQHSSSLVLTAPDLNALFYHWKKDNSYDVSATFQIQGNVLSIDSSFPLDGILGFKDRYFRGNISLIESPSTYPLPLILNSVQMEGKKLPNMIIDLFKKPDAAQSFIEQFGLSSAVSQVKSMQIHGNTLEVELYGNQ